ncbi:ATP-binding protein [Selenihalanaerobacter shriftii]|uniref:Histidine kinase-like ATPase domain-containing protein n=1 Tax=Selenihalanaerobacter shriftii TaxID=142842 RepID=A0A1T4KEL8_9FIRM|nr:ATP-binding protein [Selenihalanaerobacter shriftii]SJZ40817.1 Histidine kinase-like ATPase domain-containing protein [Selenihalanaerobacter shriftii]
MGSDRITTVSKEIQSLERTIVSKFDEVYNLEEEVEDFLAIYTDDIINLRLGFHEILVNAIEHGNNLNGQKEIEIEVIITEKHIRILISDQGKGFNWERHLSKSLDKDNFNERGRGIIIAKRVYDLIEYNNQGNQASLIKFR